MPDDPQRVEDPAQAMERLRESMKQLLSVPKKEIQRREAEALKQRQQKRKAA